QAEVLVEFLVVELAQGVLVEQRDSAPLVRIVEPLGIHVIELAPIERCAAGLRQRPLFALGLKALDGGARFRKIEKRRHLRNLPRMFQELRMVRSGAAADRRSSGSVPHRLAASVRRFPPLSLRRAEPPWPGYLPGSRRARRAAWF